MMIIITTNETKFARKWRLLGFSSARTDVSIRRSIKSGCALPARTQFPFYIRIRGQCDDGRHGGRRRLKTPEVGCRRFSDWPRTRRLHDGLSAVFTLFNPDDNIYSRAFHSALMPQVSSRQQETRKPSNSLSTMAKWKIALITSRGDAKYSGRKLRRKIPWHLTVWERERERCYFFSIRISNILRASQLL